MAKIAADDLLEGPSAIAFVTGDAVTVAKSLRDFGRTYPLLVVKGGVLDGKPLTADEVRKLADLESREVLLAKLAGAMKASLSQAVGLFAAPLSQAARLLAALEEQKRSEPQPAPPAEPAQATEPAAEAPAADAPAAEAAGDEGAAAQEVADATDVSPAADAASTTETDVAEGDATSAS